MACLFTGLVISPHFIAYSSIKGGVDAGNEVNKIRTVIIIIIQNAPVDFSIGSFNETIQRDSKV